MRSSTNPGWLRLSAGALGALIIAGAFALVGCGSSSSTSASKLSLSISEQGKKASFQVPKSAKGGLVDLSFKNNGKAPHGVQLLQYTGTHKVADVLKQLGSNSNKIPNWIKGQGGTPTVPGGQTASADLNLPAGNYLVVDAAALGGSSAPPATAPMKFTSGDSGDLPSTPATVTAASTGHDKYQWNVSGLKAGVNKITFASKGHNTLHLLLAVPVKGKAPSLAKIKSDFASNGPPPPYLDIGGAQGTAILDSGLSQTTSVDLKKPGQYVLFCPLSDRDGGKPHDQEGLLKVVTVQ